MHNRIRISLYGMMIVLLALASTFTMIPARADDGAPPPPAAPAGPSAKTANTPSDLSKVPAGTDVVVVNRSGHKVALASQQAADIITSGDPIWCPTGVLPKPGVGTCTSTATTFETPLTGLLALISTKAVNGTIWIAPGYSSAGEGGFVTIDGGSLVSLASHTLTINGGWNGISGSTLLNPNAPSVFYVPLTIIGWNNAVTLNNITIAGTSSTGLIVGTTGNIVLNNINAFENDGGAYLNNTSGPAGTITVNYSTFTGNTAGDGLNISSNRTVALKNVTAVGNSAGYGVYINNTTASGAQPVTITGVNNFSSNGTGLYVLSNGAITVGNVTADYNTAGDGVYLDNCVTDGTGSCTTLIPGAHNVTIKGSNNFNNNGQDGLEVWSSGTIIASNLTANNNGRLAAPGINPVGYEYGAGAYLDNIGTPLLAGSPLILTGTNSFTGNSSTGLYLDSWGTVTAGNVTANENGGVPLGSCLSSLKFAICDGMHVDYSKSFTLTGYGTFNLNGNDGLEAWSYAGNLTLTNLSADSNGHWGVYLDNCLFDTFPTPDICHSTGNVTLTGTNSFTNNQYTGLTIYSTGVVSTSNITASLNGLFGSLTDGAGAYIDNCNQDTGSPFLCVVTVPKSVTLSGVNTFNSNNLDGLDVYSLGAITANALTGNDNASGDGAFLFNEWNIKNFNITLSGKNVFNTNGAIGLEAYSNGNIIMSNLTANENLGGTSFNTFTDAGGAYLESKSTTALTSAITLTGVNTFNDNGFSLMGTGLNAFSDGNITISNLTANNNQDSGTLLNNTVYGPLLSHHNITLTGVNNFVNNVNGWGLIFNSTGAVNMVQVTADMNGLTGVYGIAGGALVITCGSLYLNGSKGYDLTGTTITLKGVYTDGPVAHSVTPIVTRACPIP